VQPNSEQSFPWYVSEEDEWGNPEKTPFIKWQRDPKVDPAKDDLRTWFKDKPATIFYGRQIEVIFEKKYFHWITHKALRELTTEGTVSSEIRTTENGNKIRLYWSKENRYPKRAIGRLVEEVEQHSKPDITRAIGNHAETLFGFAGARAGFGVIGPNVKSYRGINWDMTEHDLDWIWFVCIGSLVFRFGEHCTKW